MSANDLTQPPSDAIASHRVAKAPGSNKAGKKSGCRLIAPRTEHKQFPTLDETAFAHEREIRLADESFGFWQRKRRHL